MKKGWPVTRLGDLTDLVTKGTTPTSIGHEFVGDGINFVKVESISTTGEFIEEKFAHITPACHAVLGRSQLQAGDILFSIAGALGRTGFVTDEILPANTNQALAIIRLKRDVGLSPKFVLKALETGVVLEQIEKFKGGVAQQNLSLAQVRDFQIALPPLAEQQRIVGLLDEAFEGLATAKANAEKNLQNARALFESHLNDVFTKKGDGWLETTIGGVCDFRGGGTPSKAVERYWKGKIPWVSPKDMKSEIVSDSIDHISQEAIDASATSLIPKGAVLMVVRSGILARIVPLAVTGRELTINQDLKALCPKSVIESRFLYNLLESKMPELLSLVSRGATVHRLQTEQIRSLGCFLPPKAEQHQIIERIDSMRDETQRLARLYERKQAALEALKKSLLHQAFTGEL